MARIMLVLYLEAKNIDSFFFELVAPLLQLRKIAATKGGRGFVFVQKFGQQQHLQLGPARNGCVCIQ